MKEKNQFDGRLKMSEESETRFKKHFSKYYQNGSSNLGISLSEMKEWFAIESSIIKSHWIAEVCREVEGVKWERDGGKSEMIHNGAVSEILQLPSLKQD